MIFAIKRYSIEIFKNKELDQKNKKLNKCVILKRIESLFNIYFFSFR